MLDYKKLKIESKELIEKITDVEIKEWLENDNRKFNLEVEKCGTCDNYLDEFSEYGTCFDCLMNSCISGQYNGLM